MNKTAYLILASVGGLIGGWLGAVFDNGNELGALSIVGATVGGIAAIVLGYQIAKRNGL